MQQPDTTTKKGLRDLAILCLMYDAAARVSEIIGLTPGMVRIDKPHTIKLIGKGIYKPLTIKLIGKGTKARIVPLLEKDGNLKPLHDQ